MKQSIQEMAVSNATVASTTGVSTVQAKQWETEVVAAAKKKMYFEQFATVYDVPKGFKDLAVPIATTNKSFSDNTTETERTYTQLDNVTVVTFTPGDHKYGVTISETVVRTSQVSYIDWAKDQLAYDMALDIDTAMGTAIAAAASPAATLFGGDGTATNDLEAGDILSTDLIAKGTRYLRANGWFPDPAEPFVLFISATGWEALVKDSQFSNAAEFGGREVVYNGEIAQYLGVRVILTEQIPSASNWGAGGTLAGHTCLLVKAKKAYGLAWGLRPRLDMEYKKDEAAHKVYIDCAYATDSLHEGATVLIKVLDA